MMIDYFPLIKKFPELFDNDNALLNIVTDANTIHNWQSGHRKYLSKNNLPFEWAEIGVLLDDPYNILIRDLVEFPDGAMRGYIRSITTASLRSGYGTVVLPEYQGKILLLHQYRHPTRQWHYEIPRGYGEPNTPPDKNAHNEIEEETGGKIEDLISLGEFHNNTGYEAVSVTLFYAKLASIGEANVNEGIKSFIWLTVQELEEWIANERITDGFTIAAYTKAKLKKLI